MPLSSIFFVLVFLPIVLIFYKVLCAAAPYYSKGVWTTRLYLFAGSLVFYFCAEPRLVLVLLASCIFNFIFGLFLQKAYDCNLKGKTLLISGIILNAGLLAYFKYTNFFVDNIQWLAELAGLNSEGDAFSIKRIALPLGISFYTFQALSYLIDIYKGTVRATRSFVEFGCYMTLFPQLIMGPIIRYGTIKPELRELKLSPTKFMEGVTRFTIGMAKKLLLGDTMAAVAEAAFSCPTTDLSTSAAWAGILCYTLQVYFDFSGYSDMAIGIGKMLGFTFPENFNYPYICRSLSDFWRRWHMTLSSWLRDYIYFPLGGSRKGNIRTYINLFITFTICGLWHGSSWLFILWGMYNGIIVMLERRFPGILQFLPRPLQHFYALAILVIGRVLFRSFSLESALGYFQSMFTSSEGGLESARIWLEFHSTDTYLALIIGVIACCPVLPYVKKHWEHFLNNKSTTTNIILESLRYSFVLLLFCFCLLPLFGATYRPFIYFQF